MSNGALLPGARSDDGSEGVVVGASAAAPHTRAADSGGDDTECVTAPCAWPPGGSAGSAAFAAAKLALSRPMDGSRTTLGCLAAPLKKLSLPNPPVPAPASAPPPQTGSCCCGCCRWGAANTDAGALELELIRAAEAAAWTCSWTSMPPDVLRARSSRAGRGAGAGCGWSSSRGAIGRPNPPTPIRPRVSRTVYTLAAAPRRAAASVRCRFNGRTAGTRRGKSRRRRGGVRRTDAPRVPPVSLGSAGESSLSSPSGAPLLGLLGGTTAPLLQPLSGTSRGRTHHARRPRGPWRRLAGAPRPAHDRHSRALDGDRGAGGNCRKERLQLRVCPAATPPRSSRTRSHRLRPISSMRDKGGRRLLKSGGQAGAAADCRRNKTLGGERTEQGAVHSPSRKRRRKSSDACTAAAAWKAGVWKGVPLQRDGAARKQPSALI
eukprot:357586-Chlamydomonas_euryale.AAC.12